MSAYTITRETILAARKRRSEQVKAARGELLKALAGVPTWEQRRIKREYRARIIPGLAHIEFVNGTTIHTGINIARLTEWARLTKGTLDMRLWHCEGCNPPVQMTLESERQPGIRSGVTMYGHDTVPVTHAYRPERATFADLGDPIRLVAPADGGEFILATA